MIAVDKQLHLGGGFAVALLVGLHTQQWQLGLLAGVTAGAVKEVLDEIAYGGADFKDFLATAAGAALGALWLYL